MEKKHQYRGLTKQEVEESRRLHGENVLTPPQKASLWSQFLEKFEDPIIRILLVAWLLSMIIAGVHCWGPEAKGFTAFLEPIGIFFAIMLASCVGFFFEVKANKAFDILNTVNDDILVKVIRDGNICQIPVQFAQMNGMKYGSSCGNIVTSLVVSACYHHSVIWTILKHRTPKFLTRLSWRNATEQEQFCRAVLSLMRMTCSKMFGKPVTQRWGWLHSCLQSTTNR